MCPAGWIRANPPPLRSSFHRGSRGADLLAPATFRREAGAGWSYVERAPPAADEFDLLGEARAIVRDPGFLVAAALALIVSLSLALAVCLTARRAPSKPKRA